MGVLSGLARLKFSGSPIIRGYINDIVIINIKNVRAPIISFMEK